jgi:hypothetical protein
MHSPPDSHHKDKILSKKRKFPYCHFSMVDKILSKKKELSPQFWIKLLSKTVGKVLFFENFLFLDKILSLWWLPELLSKLQRMIDQGYNWIRIYTYIYVNIYKYLYTHMYIYNKYIKKMIGKGRNYVNIYTYLKMKHKGGGGGW